MPRALLLELQRNKHIVRRVEPGADIRGHCQQLTRNLIVHLLKTHFFTPILDCENQLNRIELATPTCLPQHAVKLGKRDVVRALLNEGSDPSIKCPARDGENMETAYQALQHLKSARRY